MVWHAAKVKNARREWQVVTCQWGGRESDDVSPVVTEDSRHEPSIGKSSTPEFMDCCRFRSVRRQEVIGCECQITGDPYLRLTSQARAVVAACSYGHTQQNYGHNLHLSFVMPQLWLSRARACERTVRSRVRFPHLQKTLTMIIGNASVPTTVHAAIKTVRRCPALSC